MFTTVIKFLFLTLLNWVENFMISLIFSVKEASKNEYFKSILGYKSHEFISVNNSDYNQQ